MPQPPPDPTQSASPYAPPQQGAYTARPNPEDWRPKAIAIMTTVGGGVAIFFSLINIILALGLCVTLLTAVYSAVVGAICLSKGIPMLSNPTYPQAPPYATAIMQIINILACDPVNLTLGIIILVWLNDPEVRSQFRS